MFIWPHFYNLIFQYHDVGPVIVPALTILLMFEYPVIELPSVPGVPAFPGVPGVPGVPLEPGFPLGPEFVVPGVPAFPGVP
jgi:hypothetical protein